MPSVLHGGRSQSFIVFPSAVFGSPEGAFGFNPDIMIARDDELGHLERLQLLQGLIPPRKRVGGVASDYEGIRGDSPDLISEIWKEPSILRRHIDVQVGYDGNPHCSIIARRFIQTRPAPIFSRASRATSTSVCRVRRNALDAAVDGSNWAIRPNSATDRRDVGTASG
jgi:hypothetical protein